MNNRPKSYRLLKPLPGIKIGSPVTWNPGYNKYLALPENYKNHSEGYMFSNEIIEMCPEWFSEVVQRDWEIVAITDSLGRSLNVEAGSEFENSTGTILTVRRLSDGQLFTVGDLLCGLGFHQDEIHEIKSIYPINGTLGFEYGNEGAIVIQAARKSPPQSPEPPPLGVMPEWLWKEQRLKEIDEAMTRFVEANKDIPQDWFDEATTLRAWLLNRKENTKPPPQKERITAVLKRMGESGMCWAINLNKGISEIETPAIENAVEQVLNGDDGGWTKNYGIMFPKEATQLYTEKQLLDAEEAAWKASRKLSGHDYHHIPYDFRTFSDYKNTKK